MTVIDFNRIAHHRARAWQFAICASLLVGLSYTYSLYGQFAEMMIVGLFALSFFLCFRAHARAAAFELCARNVSPSQALQFCGGSRGILFPRREHVIPPAN
jgi:hypothetical protein